MSLNRRALHFVLKIGSLKKNVEFFRDRLGMKVLRHEVFDKGCEAACNGPYDTKWSKTMIGYGPEDDHFVLELTYNYSVGGYKLGNDLQFIKLLVERERFFSLGGTDSDSELTILSPDGYKFLLAPLNDGRSKEDVSEVCLSCINLKKSLEYWSGLLKMSELDSKEELESLLSYHKDQAKLRLRQIDSEMDHKSAFGRIAFSCASEELKPIEKTVNDAGQKILTPFISLDTPGKATVQVVILADPDGHEICFVGDEGFRELSQVDPDANSLIERSIQEDKSDEWYEKKNLQKQQA